MLVADGGGNVVLPVDRKGKVSNFFIPPVIKAGACKDVENNAPVPGTGCDPVPTGLAYGPRSTLYVSTLSSKVPGEGRVYVLDAYSGKVKRVISGLDAPTGVAVDWCGNVYVSELMDGLATATDLSTVGRIVKIAPNGSKTYAQVTMPVGLLIDNGVLYSSAWSVAGMFFPDSERRSDCQSQRLGIHVGRALIAGSSRKRNVRNAACRIIRRRHFCVDAVSMLCRCWTYDQGVRGRSTGLPSRNTSSRS